MTRPEKQDLQQEFVERSLQYYIAARYAAAADFIPVTGNMFHHAIEMLLKAHLCKTLSESQLKNLGHNLKKTWRLFKNDVHDPSLDQLDSTISQIHKFEDIRYPDTRHGMLALIEFGKPTTVPSKGTGRERQYKIAVTELDNLMQIIFKRTKLNPEFFAGRFRNKPDAIEFFSRWNEHPIWK